MRQYAPLIRRLEDFGHDVVAYDCLGCGSSDKPLDWYAYSTQAHRDDLLAIWREHAHQRTILVGHSYGTSQLLWLASQDLDVTPLALVLLGSSATVRNPRC